MRYLLEQPSFGVDGDVPPDALLDFAAAEKVVSSRGGGRRGRFDREEDERDFEAVEEDEDGDVRLDAGTT